jgi:cation:H+ antiporter
MKRFGWFFLAGGLTLPWILMRFLGIHLDPLVVSLFAGVAIMGAAFLLSWAGEAAESDFSGTLIIAVLALIVMLPEYAVDGTLSWKAGKDAAFAPYAVANMTGANRLLIGVGWFAVFLVLFLKTKRKTSGVDIKPVQRIDCGILLLATLYVGFIALKGSIAWYDAGILFAVFLVYLWKISKAPKDGIHHEAVGPAKAIADIRSKNLRRVAWLSLMAYSAGAIFLSAEPFAHGLIEGGKTLGVDEFMLVQWVAPLASELPEFVVAVLFVMKIQSYRGLGVLVSSGINQLTLLIGSIPILFMLSAGHMASFDLDQRQSHEILLTAAQSLFAVALLANLNLSWKEAVALVVLFVITTIFTGFHFWFSIMYVVLAILFCAMTFRTSSGSWKAIGKAMVSNKIGEPQ